MKEERNNPPFISMFKFGDFDINSKVVLAPMAGYTFTSYREFMNKFGIGLCYTEMVSVKGLIYDNQNTLKYIDFKKSDVPTGVQLFGSELEDFTKAVEICEKYNPNIDFYDVNMACPVPKVTKTGAGSSLLKDPQKCKEIILAIKKATNKPVTAKIRLGWDKDTINFQEVIKELEDAGVALIAIHARTAKDLYTGKPNYEILRDFRKNMRVPLVISGNIFSPEEAKNALEITGADAVMVARGGVGNPLLITNITKYLNGEEIIPLDIEKQIEYCLELAKKVIEEKGENTGMRIFRSMGSRFFNSLPNTKVLKNRISSEINTYQDLVDILNEYINEFLTI